MAATIVLKPIRKKQKSLKSKGTAASIKIRVFLVDDHPVVRYGLAESLERAGDMAVCGEAGNAEQALELLRDCQVDVISVDLTLGKRSGIDLIRDIRFLNPEVALVVYTMCQDISVLESALRAGARVCIQKVDTTDKLIEAIRGMMKKSSVKGDNSEESGEEF
ncbi:MAG: response regulator transcription factor [Opitutales bacterium]|nr:response regulator transcription factor [Opitutales bacterium]